MVDTVQYFAIAQSFHKNYVFNYEGGEIFNYNVGLAIDGTKATFTNLFNMYEASLSSWSRCYDYPVEGVYDAEAGTITIPTTVNGIVCGDYGGYYDAMLLAGEISEGGTLTPAEELVFNVTTGEDGQIAAQAVFDLPKGGSDQYIHGITTRSALRGWGWGLRSRTGCSRF